MSIDFDSVLKNINYKLIENNSTPLNTSQMLVLRGIWQYQTYNQIATEAGYSPTYFTNVVAPELCQRLSKLIGQRVTKKNCRNLLISYLKEQNSSKITPTEPDSIEISGETNSNKLPDYPSGSVALDSPFYIKRRAIEDLIDREINKPGALVRIKGAKEIGKTSILTRTLDRAKRQGYYAVSFSLEQIDLNILKDLNRLLRCLCLKISHQLGLEPKLDDYWDEDLGCKISCTLYFQEYLLNLVDAPIVLAFDDIDLIFEHFQVAKDFLPLLRSWYEETKRYLIWQKLRLIVVHSTEIYIPLQINQSPFNVGLTIDLTPFSLNEVRELAQRYQLNWGEDSPEANQLMNLVEGHPALVQMALYHLSSKQMTLPQLLETAPTPGGIYNHHLQRHWVALQKHPELLLAINAIVNNPEAIELNPILVHKLNSMGLIEQSENKIRLRCELYRQYFVRSSA